MRNTRIGAALALGFALALAIDGASHAADQPGTDNAALRYWMAFAFIKEPPGSAATTSSLERVSTGAAPWDEAALGAVLDANSAAVTILRRGASMAFCDWGLDYEMGPRMPVAHLPKARVLGRLTALAGLRAASRGQTGEAVDTWLDGVRFSQHVAEGGSLISVLTARAVLRANLQALVRTAGARPLDANQAQRIAVALQALPPGAFDWSAAIAREKDTVEITLRQLAGSADPAAAYRDLTAGSPPAPFALPTEAQIHAYRRLMDALVTTLRLPPDAAREQLETHEASRRNLPPLLRDFVPAVTRLNDTRAEIEREKRELMKLLGKMN
jgi:hypothetical protein